MKQLNMQRPCKCNICGKLMKYYGQPGYEEEVCITVAETSDYNGDHPLYRLPYVHLRCAKKIIALIKPYTDNYEITGD